MTDLIKNLKSLRAKNGLTQADAAKQAGMGESTWQKVELGLSSPRLSTLDKMASVLNTTVSDLIK